LFSLENRDVPPLYRYTTFSFFLPCPRTSTPKL
jgi:hypothetical protein